MLNVILLLLLCSYTKSEFIVYRAEVGSQLGIDNAISDINYTANGTYAGVVPTNLTVNSVKWCYFDSNFLCRGLLPRI